ncbi:MAG: hypothetical protein A3G35_05910 [candidate division NC10 bacterium RIFCSPLOWO2_12_FULL_66_18]|nr:MAG: hypothetical protein A3G35_05910 [candidate division NC10 bacterium RIFCSPLOWO2_12_FULL_66_18]
MAVQVFFRIKVNRPRAVIPPGVFVFRRDPPRPGAAGMPRGLAIQQERPGASRGSRRRPRILFDAGGSGDYSGSRGIAITQEDDVKLRLRNLRVAPTARWVRSERLEHPAGHRRAELSVTGMICSL